MSEPETEMRPVSLLRGGDIIGTAKRAVFVCTLDAEQTPYGSVIVSGYPVIADDEMGEYEQREYLHGHGALVSIAPKPPAP